MCSSPRICRPTTRMRSGQSTAVCAPSLSTPRRCRQKRKTTVSISGICWTELHKNYVSTCSDSANKPQQNHTRPCTVLCTQYAGGCFAVLPVRSSVFLNTAWVCAAPTVSHPALKVLPEQLVRRPQILRQALQGLCPQFLWHPVKGFGNAAGDAGKGVAVSPFTPDAASGNRLQFPLSNLRRWMPGRLPAASGRPFR